MWTASFKGGRDKHLTGGLEHVARHQSLIEPLSSMVLGQLVFESVVVDALPLSAVALLFVPIR